MMSHHYYILKSKHKVYYGQTPKNSKNKWHELSAKRNKHDNRQKLKKANAIQQAQANAQTKSSVWPEVFQKRRKSMKTHYVLNNFVESGPNVAADRVFGLSQIHKNHRDP